MSCALMPPPPPKRIKRPAKVLDEDDYTDALSEIIARDYFPGLLESKTQQEYLTALESNNATWIADAGAKLREVMTPGPHTRRQARAARNSRFNTPLPSDVTPRIKATPGATPRGFRGDETPASSVTDREESSAATKPEIDTSTLSLSTFQSTYTSEDNESFNALLDNQNTKRRQKHAYHWAPDQRIPSARQIAHRNREARLLKQQAEDEANGTALIPITVGGPESKPSRPDSWKIKTPTNTFMFPASSVDESGLETVAETNERTSRAAPKSVIHTNTRFPPPPLQHDENNQPPPSPSLSAIRAAISGHPRLSASETLDYSAGNGAETPRVNGYAFVDDDNETPEPEPTLPTYLDLLAGHSADPTPNPFSIAQPRRRESLHHRMVERDSRKKRVNNNTATTAAAGAAGRAASITPHVRVEREKGGALTPAAERLLSRMAGVADGVGGSGNRSVGRGEGRAMEQNMWTTPKHTPRRGRVAGLQSG